LLRNLPLPRNQHLKSQLPKKIVKMRRKKKRKRKKQLKRVRKR
jgi:hypothetical protein